MQAVILAGGLGTRLRPRTETVPKAMIPVRGRPFLEYELELLRAAGINDVVVCVGHLGKAVQDHFGEGKEFGIRMRYSWDGPKLLGPAGALKQAEAMLNDSFFVTYGDAYLRAPYAKVMDALESSEKLGVMTVYRNDNKYGRSDLEVKDGFVVRYDKSRPTSETKWINFGVSALRREALNLVKKGVLCGEEEFYGKLISRRELLAFPVDQRFYEIGTPDSLAEFERLMAGHR